MNTHETIMASIGLLETLPTKEIKFDSAVTVKMSPHSLPFNCWGAAIGNNDLYLMDSSGDWHKLEVTDRNAQPVAASVLQRLKLIIHQ